jgi:hypothetical protein
MPSLCNVSATILLHALNVGLIGRVSEFGSACRSELDARNSVTSPPSRFRGLTGRLSDSIVPTFQRTAR